METSNADKQMHKLRAVPVYLRDLAPDKQAPEFLGPLPDNPNDDDIIVGYYLGTKILDD